MTKVRNVSNHICTERQGERRDKNDTSVNWVTFISSKRKTMHIIRYSNLDYDFIIKFSNKRIGNSQSSCKAQKTNRLI